MGWDAGMFHQNKQNMGVDVPEYVSGIDGVDCNPGGGSYSITPVDGRTRRQISDEIIDRTSGGNPVCTPNPARTAGRAP